MQNKRAYLVLGAESTGTRYLTRLLMGSGCAGSPHHKQTHDATPPTEELIVWRRSFPHDGKWPELEEMLESLGGYKVFAFITIRDWYASASSQVDNRRPKDMAGAYKSLREAYRRIFQQVDMHELPYAIVSYELLSDDKYISKIFEHFHLTYYPTNFTNQNTKYYED